MLLISVYHDGKKISIYLLLKEIYFWWYKSNWTGFSSLVWKRCDRKGSEALLSDISRLLSSLSWYSDVEKKKNLFTSYDNACQYQLPTLLIWTRSRLDRLVLFTIYDRFCRRYCWRKRHEMLSFWRPFLKVRWWERDWKLTYNLEVYITVSRWRKFEVNAASKVTSVFFLNNRKRKAKRKIDKISRKLS